MKTPREKYNSDPHYKVLVDTLLLQIQLCNYTPSELREAVILASIVYEENKLGYNPPIINPEVEKALKTITKWADSK